MKTNYNAILDYILTETIKRKNEHPTNTFKGTDYKAMRIIPIKEVVDKFGVNEFEVEGMYFELTSNFYIEPSTGNATLKGFEFSDAGGFTKKAKRERRKDRANFIISFVSTVAVILAIVLAIIQSIEGLQNIGALPKSQTDKMQEQATTPPCTTLQKDTNHIPTK